MSQPTISRANWREHSCAGNREVPRELSMLQNVCSCDSMQVQLWGSEGLSYLWNPPSCHIQGREFGAVLAAEKNSAELAPHPQLQMHDVTTRKGTLKMERSLSKFESWPANQCYTTRGLLLVPTLQKCDRSIQALHHLDSGTPVPALLSFLICQHAGKTYQRSNACLDEKGKNIHCGRRKVNEAKTKEGPSWALGQKLNETVARTDQNTVQQQYDLFAREFCSKHRLRHRPCPTCCIERDCHLTL